MLFIKLAIFFGKFSVSFRSIFEKFENKRKTLTKWFWTNFVKKDFFGELSENCQEMFGIFSFLPLLNYLLTGLLVPYREIPSPRFLRTDLASSVRTSKPRA